MGERKIEVAITGDSSGLIAALQQAAKGTEGLAHQMEGAIGGVASMLERFAAPLAGLLGVMGGGAIFREAIAETSELGDALAKGAQKIGISVEALSGLAHAAKLSNVEFDDLVSGMAKLAKNMQDSIFTPTSISRAAFKALGVEVQTASGTLRNTDDVLLEVAEKFAGMRDSAGKTALAMDLFGKSGAKLIPLLNEGREGIAEFTAEAKRLGISMTTEQAKASEKYRDDMERVEAALKGVKIRIASEVMPALTRLAEWFTEKAPAMLEGASNALHGVESILSNTVVQWAALSLAISFSVENLIWPALMKAATGIQAMMTQMAAAQFTGASLLTSLTSMLNPVLLVTAAIVGLAFGYRHLVTEESRAAEEHLKEVQKMGQLQGQSQQLTSRLVELDAIQKSAKSSASAKTAAEEEEKTIIRELVAIYPNFMKFLYDESGKRREISEAIKLENKDRLENAQRTVAEAQAHLANAKALLEERKQRAESARYAPGGPGGAGVAKSAAQGYLNASIADSEQAIKIEDQALQQALQNLQKLQQATTDSKKDAPNVVSPYGKGTKAKEEKDNSLANYAALQAAEFEHWKNMQEITMDGLQKQEEEINLSFAKKFETAIQAGASEEDLAQLNGARLQAIEKARTDFAQKQADERKKIAEQEAQERRRILEETGTAEEGFFDGIHQYMERQGSTFQQWAQAAQQMLQGVENAFARGFHGILTGQMTFAQGLKTIWQGITGAIVQMLAQMVAKWIVASIAAKIFKDSASDAAKDNAVAQQESAASTLWATYAGIPFVGPAIAAGFIALMNASLMANAAGAKGIVGAAEGGWFDRPTLTMIGEGRRPELVVPDVAFRDFATNLSANILAQERQAQAYGRQAVGFARARADQGMDDSPSYVDLRGAVIAGESLESRRQIAKMVRGAQVYHQRVYA